MKDENSNAGDMVGNQLLELQRQRAALAALPGEKAINYILEARNPAALVHSLPEEDFHFLIHDIGPEDALPILALATDTQLEYILDIEGWRQDRIQIPVLTKWLTLMMQAHPQRLVAWLVEQQPDLMDFFLHKNIQVLIREHDQDPSDFGDDFFTLDDVVYVRILPDRYPADFDESDPDEADEEGETRRTAFLQRLLARVADYDHVLYQQILMNAAGLLPVEAEESLYRLKNVRLAEKGFLPFDEAVGIYQPLDPKALYHQSPKTFEPVTEAGMQMTVPQYTSGMLPEKTAFTDALRLIDSELRLQQIQIEFAGLSNQLIAADQRLIQDRSVLREIVRKACGYLSIGIEALFNLKQKPDQASMSAHGAALIKRFPLAQIFRVGYGRVLQLKWKVLRWQKNAQYVAAGLPLSFWGETWMGVLGGLMIKKPLFFDNYQTGTLYREFETIEEVRITDQTIEQIMVIDELLSHLPVQLHRRKDQLLTYKNLMLTAWAHHHLNASRKTNGPKAPASLTQKEFHRFFIELFGIMEKAHSPAPRKTPLAMKTSFLNWLSTTTGQSALNITDRIGPSLDALFEEVDDELGMVAPKDIDPRFVTLFLIK